MLHALKPAASSAFAGVQRAFAERQISKRLRLPAASRHGVGGFSVGLQVRVLHHGTLTTRRAANVQLMRNVHEQGVVPAARTRLWVENFSYEAIPYCRGKSAQTCPT